MSRQIVGTEDPAPPKRVLDFQAGRSNKGIEFYEKALEKVKDDKGVIKVANLVDAELARVEGAGERSNIAMIGNTAVRIMEQPAIRAKVEEGFQFGMNALTMALSGGLGGTGIIGGLFARSKVKSNRRIRKEGLKNRIKTKILNENPKLLTEVKKAAENTEVEGVIVAGEVI